MGITTPPRLSKSYSKTDEEV